MAKLDLKLICTDVDGTLTDGKIYIGPNGELFKSFHVRDGMGITLAKKKGIIFAIITGRKSEIVEYRARDLGIDEIYQNVEDKKEVVRSLRLKYKLRKEQVAYLGDDVNDVVIKDLVGLFAVVGDAHPAAKKEAHLVLKSYGGQGALRELLDLYVLGE